MVFWVFDVVFFYFVESCEVILVRKSNLVWVEEFYLEIIINNK